jgi:hypothetical protein
VLGSEPDVFKINMDEVVWLWYPPLRFADRTSIAYVELAVVFEEALRSSGR